MEVTTCTRIRWKSPQVLARPHFALHSTPGDINQKRPTDDSSASTASPLHSSRRLSKHGHVEHEITLVETSFDVLHDPDLCSRHAQFQPGTRTAQIGLITLQCQAIRFHDRRLADGLQMRRLTISNGHMRWRRTFAREHLSLSLLEVGFTVFPQAVPISAFSTEAAPEVHSSTQVLSRLGIRPSFARKRVG